jgi:hypothetical protein
MVGLAYARSRAGFYGWSTAAEDKPVAQMELLKKATAINPGYALAYYVKSTVLWIAKEYPGSASSRRDGAGSRSQFSLGVYRDKPVGSPARTLRTIYRTHQTGLRPKPPRSLQRQLVHAPGPCRILSA